MKKKNISIFILCLSVSLTVFGQSVLINPSSGSQQIITAYDGNRPYIITQRANGTAAAPTAIQNNQELFILGARGHNGLGFNVMNNASITFASSQTHAPGALGAYMFFSTIENNTQITRERMRIADNGNIGLGTTTPGFPLNFPNLTGNKISLWGQSGNHYGLGIDNSLMMIHTDNVGSDIAFGHGTFGAFTETLRIKGNGNLGVGTTTPNAPLQFSNAIVNKKIVLYEQTNNEHQFTGLGLGLGFLRYQIPNTNDAHIFYSGTSSTTSNELFRIQGNGNVGIGLASTPLAKLHVKGTSILSDSPTVGEQVLIGETLENDAKVSILSTEYAFALKVDGTGSTIKALLVDGGAAVFGNSSFGNDLEVNQTFTSNGPAIFNNSATFSTGNNVITPELTINNVNTQFGNANLTGGLTINGSLAVNGSLAKLSGSFKIDHPQDPENKYLYHSFVESPDMMNVYNGNIVTDKRGYATVMLPAYFEALNVDFRYQLTAIGTFSDVIVYEKIKDNQFKIKSKKPNIEVSWQITGIRNDIYAKENRIQVEVEKPIQEKNKLLYNSKTISLQSSIHK